MIESSRAALCAFNRPLDRIELGRIAPAVRKNASRVPSPLRRVSIASTAH
jgi:hypothetical protein